MFFSISWSAEGIVSLEFLEVSIFLNREYPDLFILSMDVKLDSSSFKIFYPIINDFLLFGHNLKS